MTALSPLRVSHRRGQALLDETVRRRFSYTPNSFFPVPVSIENDEKVEDLVRHLDMPLVRLADRSIARRAAEGVLLENDLGLRRGQLGYGKLLLEIHTYPACQSDIDVDQIALGIIFDE